MVRLLLIICLIGTAVFLEKDRILELGQYIIQRIADSTSNKYDNSSVVHYLYYRNFGTIIKNENIINFLFGTGFGTSGQHYTWFNNQYSNLSSWVVENDYINIFLNQGFFGFFAWIYFELRIIFVSKKVKNLENIGLIITALFIGLFYNIQFNWFILVEIAIYFLATENINFFADNKEETL